MKHKKWIAILLLLLMCWPAAAWAVVEAPPEGYVADYANMLTDETEAYLIEKSRQLDEATGAQIVVVTVDFLDGMDIEDYAYTLFNDWGIGDAEKNNGLLLLLAIGEDNYWCMQGKGLEGVLSSGMLGDYLYEYLEPDFAKADYDAGVRKVFDALLDWFDNYYSVQGSNAAGNDVTVPVQPVREQNSQNEDSSWFWLVVVLIIIVILISMNNRRKDRKNKNNKWNGGSGGGRTEDYTRRSRTQMPRRGVFIPPGAFGPGERRGNSSGGSSSGGFGGFGEGGSRGGGAGRSSGGFGGFGGSSGGFGGFGGGGSRGGGAGRR